MLIALQIAPLHAAESATSAAPPLPAVRISRMETAEYRKLRLEGFDALYNMDYPAARARFDEMCRMAPDHPAGPLYKATAQWVEILYSRRRLQTGVYNSASFYAETKEKEKVDPAVDREFRRLIGLAVQKAEAAVRRNSSDVDAVYYEGAGHALLATYEGTVARSFISALRNGSKAVNLHRAVLKADASFADAYLTIGTYDYVVGSLPFFVKILAAIGGFHGSRERGIEELRTAAERGRYANDDARVVLITFFAREKRYADALAVLDTLSAKYPRNYLFMLERAAAMARLGRHSESYAIFEQLLRDPSLQKVADMVHFQYADALASQKRNAEALAHFQAVGDMNGAAPELVTRSHLRAGQLLDMLSRRTEAIAEYKVVLARENVFDSHDQANNCLKKPFVPERD